MKIIMSYLKEDEKLKECLASLEKYSPNIEVIKLKSDPKVTKSAEHAFDKYIKENGMDDDLMEWHPDMRATENWYEKLMTYYNLFDVIGCKLLYPDKTINHYGGGIYADGRGFHPHQHSLNIGLNEPLSVPFVTGPSMVIKKHVHKRLKGWDHQFWSYIDVDFCFRAWRAGFKVGVVPVELIHFEGEDQLKNRTNTENGEIIYTGFKQFTTKHMDYLSTFK